MTVTVKLYTERWDAEAEEHEAEPVLQTDGFLPRFTGEAVDEVVSAALAAIIEANQADQHICCWEVVEVNEDGSNGRVLTSFQPHGEGVCPNCEDGCKIARFCAGCDTPLCEQCYAEHNEDAPCHV